MYFSQPQFCAHHPLINVTVTFLHFVACSTPQRQPWHQPMVYCVRTPALMCVGKCMKILVSHDEMDYRLNWRLARLSQTHVMYHWEWWAYDVLLCWEGTVFISDSNLSWVLFLLFCTTKSELPRRRAGDRYKHVLWIYLYIQTNTTNKNAVYFTCSLQRDSVDFYGRHEGDAEFS